MLLLSADVKRVSATELQALIDNQVLESKYIEYKAMFASGVDASTKIRLLAGISSFANTDGGDLLIGIRAEDGIPKEITPVGRKDFDSLRLTIEQLVQTGLAPRIAPALHEIRISDTHSVLLIRIARSWAMPHRVTLGGHDKFYARNSGGKYQMDVDQLRGAFALSASWHDRVTDVQRHRLIFITKQDELNLCSSPLIVLHMIPYDSLDPFRVFDLKAVYASNDIAPNLDSPFDRRFNLDGVYAWSSSESGITASCVYAYTQIFRSGMIEMVNASFALRDFGSELPALTIEVDILKAFRRFLRTQELLGLSMPIVALVSLLNVQGYHLGTDHLRTHPAFPRDPRYKTYPFRRNDIHLPGVTVDKFDADRGATLKPIFDALWNASGWPRCMDYTETGELAIDPSWFKNESVM